MTLACAALVVSACSSESGDGANAVPSNFDSSKGWRIVQVITNDDAAINEGVGRIQSCGIDVTPDNHLKVFYWQGWQSQQDFLYRAMRLDEFDASHARISRTDLPALQELFNEREPEGRCHLRKGKPTFVQRTLGTGGYGSAWQVYENAEPPKESLAQYGEYIGRVRWVDDDVIIVADQFNDPKNGRTAFTLKQFDTEWRYFGEGYFDDGSAEMLGGEKIGDAAYAVLAGRDGTTETRIAVYRFDGKTWTKDFEQNVPLPGGADPAYIRNGTRPLIALSSDAGSHVYEIDIASKTLKSRVALASRRVGPRWTVTNDELYAVYSEGGLDAVGKGKGTSLEPVGKPGFRSGSGAIELHAKNGRLYAVTYNSQLQHEQLIVATPE